MSTTVIILSYKRPGNLRKIVDSLMAGPVKPAEVIVFNNDPETKLGGKFRGATVINAGRNMFCLTKHAIGLLAETEHCLFVDDDLFLSPGTLSNFEWWARKYPESVLGFFGVRLNRGSGRPYTEGTHLNKPAQTMEPTVVDVVVGRAHFCHVRKLAQAFEFRSRVPEFWRRTFLTRESEDIILSLANLYNGHRNFIMPIGTGAGFTDLPEGAHSLHKRGKHYGQRDLTVKALMGIGG